MAKPIDLHKDLSKLDQKEQTAFNAMLAKMGHSVAALSGKAAMSDPVYRQKCLSLKPEFERMAHEKGVTLAHIFTASDKPVKTYKNPTTGETYRSEEHTSELQS